MILVPDYLNNIRYNNTVVIAGVDGRGREGPQWMQELFSREHLNFKHIRIAFVCEILSNGGIF